MTPWHININASEIFAGVMSWHEAIMGEGLLVDDRCSFYQLTL